MKKLIFICWLLLFITACTNTKKVSFISRPHGPTLAKSSTLQHGKRFFNDGYYKRAMHELLPLACDGNPEAQYAVGYMYYYGLGVAQDTDVGYFWIERSSCQHFYPAVEAIRLIRTCQNNDDEVLHDKGLKMTQ